MDKNDKRYGLIIPSKDKAKGKALNPAAGFVLQKAPSAAFGGSDSSSDDSDNELEKDWLGKSMKAKAQRSVQQAQARQAALKALQQDPTVFQYDEVYDDLEKAREERKPAKEEKKPKYIENLLKSAEVRQRDYERRLERKIQKERDSEEGQFADKEAFVTSAYKAKMAEMAKLEEDERRRDAIESAMDVTKQRDLSGFYRHILKQQTDAPVIKQEPQEADPEVPTVVDEPLEDNDLENAQETCPAEPKVSKSSDKPRQYRKRKQEESPERERSPLPSESESSSESEAEQKAPKLKKTKADKEQEAEVQIKTEIELVEVKDEEEEERKKEERLKRKEVRRQMWVKRTTGPLLEAALQRYLDRKAARESVTQG
nr:EOG090X0D2W [Lepidurus arcticus]